MSTRILVCLMFFGIAAGQVSEEDVRRVSLLHGLAQRTALRKLLVADAEGTYLEFFLYEGRLTRSLRSLLQDEKVGNQARWLITLVGDQEDLKFVVETAPAHWQRAPLKTRWGYDVVCALLEPTSESEWAILRNAASGEFDDRWVDWGAIQTLKLIASPRSRQILEEARQRNEFRAKSIDKAIEYIEMNPPPFNGRNLKELAGRVAETIKIGDLEGNNAARYNQAGDKALIDFEFRTAEDLLTYTATFHKVGAVWKLRGVRETMQAFLPPQIPPRPRPRIELPPPPILAPNPDALPLMLPPPKIGPPVRRDTVER
jgi:hypothetical protein